MPEVRILLADDHALIRKGLRAVLEDEPSWRVTAEAADGWQAVQLAEFHTPEVAVLDVAMPRLNGIDAASQLLRKSPGTRVVMLSVHSDESYVLRALAAGASAYLLKDSAELDVVPAIRAVLAGREFFSPGVRHALQEPTIRRMQRKEVQDSFDLLTEREKQVLLLIAGGRSNKEAAAELQVSVSTVESHRTRLMQKLDLHSTAEIVLYAVRKKICPEP